MLIVENDPAAVDAALAAGRISCPPCPDGVLAPRCFASRDLAFVAEDLNRKLRGWSAYFRVGNSARKFVVIDNYVHERMARLASIKYRRPKHLALNRFDEKWLRDLGVYRLNGTVRYRNAHALR